MSIFTSYLVLPLNDLHIWKSPSLRHLSSFSVISPLTLQLDLITVPNYFKQFLNAFFLPVLHPFDYEALANP